MPEQQSAHAALRVIERYLKAEYYTTDDWPLLDKALLRLWGYIVTGE